MDQADSDHVRCVQLLVDAAFDLRTLINRGVAWEQQPLILNYSV